MSRPLSLFTERAIEELARNLRAAIDDPAFIEAVENRLAIPRAPATAPLVLRTAVKVIDEILGGRIVEMREPKPEEGVTYLGPGGPRPPFKKDPR
jgi:hypothetical protein